MKRREKSAEGLIYVASECCQERDEELKAWQQSSHQKERRTVDNWRLVLCIYKPVIKQATLDLLMFHALIGLDVEALWFLSVV